LSGQGEGVIVQRAQLCGDDAGRHLRQVGDRRDGIIVSGGVHPAGHRTGRVGDLLDDLDRLVHHFPAPGR
jgi:hypothetical protein